MYPPGLGGAFSDIPMIKSTPMKLKFGLLCATFCLVFSVAASDETVGRIADVLNAIKDKSYGRIFEVTARVILPPSDNTAYFGIRDDSKSLIIRRGLEWPKERFFIGDEVRIRCEISATASQPIGAFFRGITLIARHTDYKVPRNMLVSAEGDESLAVTNLPSFLTPAIIATVFGSIVFLATLILIWNVFLRALIERKGRALLKEQLGHVKAELKTEERTRLAVELHDSLAQTLTGVSLEIDTAGKFADETNSDMLKHLGIAARTLKSCRDELRNCLWDLRNRALEAKDINDAIRQTLTPHIAGVELVIRFNVPRARISDNTAHAILRIIRELTLNGIRHGKATKIWIAGSLDGAKLRFSVRDNGSGFNPEEAPGFALGHYGLLGIRERIDAFEGEFRIDSTPGKGTKATIAILAPQEEYE